MALSERIGEPFDGARCLLAFHFVPREVGTDGGGEPTAVAVWGVRLLLCI